MVAFAAWDRCLRKRYDILPTVGSKGKNAPSGMSGWHLHNYPCVRNTKLEPNAEIGTGQGMGFSFFVPKELYYYKS